jgi:hypothetical protein
VCPWDSLHPLLWTEAEQDLLDFSYAYTQLNEILDQVDVALLFSRIFYFYSRINEILDQVDVALLFFRIFYFYFRINKILYQVDVATEIFEPVLNPKGWKQLFQAQILFKKKSLSQCSTLRAGPGSNSENSVPWAKFIYFVG